MVTDMAVAPFQLLPPLSDDEYRENRACAMCLLRPADGGELCRACEDRLDAWLERASSA